MSSRKPNFDSWTVRGGFLLEILELEQAVLDHSGIVLSVSFEQCFILIYIPVIDSVSCVDLQTLALSLLPQTQTCKLC